MAIEFFTKEGRNFNPKASIRAQGQLGINQSAIDKFDLKDDEDVLLGYDREQKIIVIKRINKSEQGSKKIAIRGQSGTIGAKGFLDFFEIPYKKTKSYRLEFDQVNNHLHFYLESNTGENNKTC